MQNIYSAKGRLLWLRSEKGQNILRVRAKVLDAARNWFKHQGYMEIQGPALISWGDSSFFEVQYYEGKAYLTHGLQPYALAMMPSFGKIYTIAPSFRPERRESRRHLTEYWCIEAEEAWCDLQGIMKVQEDLLTNICETLTKNAFEELKKLGRDIAELSSIQNPFPQITYNEALKILQSDDFDIKWGESLSLNQEEHLTHHFNQPFFVTHYPMGIPRLFCKVHSQRPELTLTSDLMVPGYGEIASAMEMIDLKELLRRMNEEKMKSENYRFYKDLEKYGACPPCSGFSLGVERVVMWICKLKNIENAIAFPRLRDRLYP